MLSNRLSELKKYSKVVADTGDFNLIKKFSPLDSTTNPSLILNASISPQYQNFVEDIVKKFLEKFPGIKNFEELKKNEKFNMDDLLDSLAVSFGYEILQLIPGRVSTEVDARLSFDVDASIARAKKIIKMYEEKGISKDRILIKLASTWEMFQVSKELEIIGIHTNMTLIFSIHQAVCCGKISGSTLISPFCGRVLDYFKKAFPEKAAEFEKNDPGVKLINEIFNYFKKYDFKTETMGASFRNTSEIVNLTGCDLLTISPSLLSELENTKCDSLERKLSAESAKN